MVIGICDDENVIRDKIEKICINETKKYCEDIVIQKYSDGREVLEKGRKLIRELLADKKEISIRELDEKAKEQGISGRTMRDVRSRMKTELEYRVNEKQENSIRLKE